MSEPNAPPRASQLLKQQSWSPESKPNAQPRASPLLKQQSWSPDMLRDEAWSRRKGHHKLRRSQSSLRRTVTDYDLDELKACFELGFGFDSPDIDPKLSETFPALEFYQKVNKQYSQSLSRTTSSSTAVPDSDKSSCSIESPSSSIFDPGIWSFVRYLDELDVGPTTVPVRSF
ncbi:hypothetical protein Vadar_032549 [Vaccinium darrowii]|uniref:Uncharacterized protein n=1 Tax=Vaccinium darrowii TaxID=229202 RepID=A0ACB7X5U2_9ERIC|nr:hypothetical protein Vadar_032549 [Vaccinium darrowii]